MLNGLDLFSGIGGITLALSPWVKTIAYCENDKYAQAVLLSQMARGNLPNAPIWDDIKTFGGHCLSDGDIDIIYGGFPCQDISEIHVGEGLAGQRSGLFWEIMRLAEEIKPQFIFLENVRNIRAKGLGIIARTLAECSYDCRWDILPAFAGEGFSRGERWFCLAKANGKRLEGLELDKASRSDVRQFADLVLPPISEADFSAHFREDNELPVPVDEVRALGNSVVVRQARTAFMRLMGIN